MRPSQSTLELSLDTTTQQRIQRQIDLGHHSDPAAVIAHAIKLLDIEEDWLPRHMPGTQAIFPAGISALSSRAA